MSHYARVVDGIVVDVLVGELADIQSACADLPGQWIQTSYNTRGNVHYGTNGKPDGLPPLRGNYAGIGGIYDAENDVFYTQSPYPSWVLDKETWQWFAPVPYPDDGFSYLWDEAIVNWVKLEPAT